MARGGGTSRRCPGRRARPPHRPLRELPLHPEEISESHARAWTPALGPWPAGPPGGEAGALSRGRRSSPRGGRLSGMVQTCPSPCRSQRPGPGADCPGPVGNPSAPPPPAGVEPSSARRHADKGRILTASGPRQEVQPHRDDPARAVGSRSTGAGAVLDSTAADEEVLGPRSVPADADGGRSDGPDAWLAA